MKYRFTQRWAGSYFPLIEEMWDWHRAWEFAREWNKFPKMADSDELLTLAQHRNVCWFYVMDTGIPVILGARAVIFCDPQSLKLLFHPSLSGTGRQEQTMKALDAGFVRSGLEGLGMFAFESSGEQASAAIRIAQPTSCSPDHDHRNFNMCLAIPSGATLAQIRLKQLDGDEVLFERVSTFGADEWEFPDRMVGRPPDISGRLRADFHVLPFRMNELFQGRRLGRSYSSRGEDRTSHS